MKTFSYNKFLYFLFKFYKKSLVVVKRVFVFIWNIVNYLAIAVTTSLFLLLILYWGQIINLPFHVFKDFGFFLFILYAYRFLYFIFYDYTNFFRLFIKSILLLGVFLFTVGILDNSFSEELSLIIFTLVVGIIFLRLWTPIVQNIYSFFNKIEYLFVLSFLLIIFFGAVFIFALPGARTQHISFIDALFVSTSAVCVTGLTPFEISTVLTNFGQMILLVLIQLGGIGIITFLSFMAYSGKTNVSFYQGKITSSSLGIAKSQSRLFLNSFVIVIIVTFIFEFLGALILYLTFPDSYYITSQKEKIFISIFHSVSAFCNAGFSNVSGGLAHPSFNHSFGFLLTISFLIIFGGLGFFTLFQIYLRFKEIIFVLFLKKKKKFFSLANYTHLGLTSRLVIQVTLILIITSFVIYLLLEVNNSLLTENWLSKIVTSFFMIVVPRTAGFSVVDLTHLKMATLVLIILLMWIGASPVSTGGGIKTSTVAIAFKTAFAFGLNQKDVYMFNRKISLLSIRKALVVIFFSFFLIFIAAFLLSIFDGDKPFLYILFECFSAYSTVGLSCNLTPQLSVSSKLVLIFLMFIGRIGFITFLSVFFRYRRENLYELPEEEILI